MPPRRTWSETLRRAVTMSPREAATRLAQRLRQERDALRIALNRPPPAVPENSAHDLAAPAAGGRFLFDAADVPNIVAELAARLPETTAHILEQAEKLAQSRFDLLGYQDLDCGTPIDWHRDPVSGRTAPKLPWSRVPYLDESVVGDHKLTWELNRHQHLVTLAKAAWLRPDGPYATLLVGRWYAWLEANPYGVGINWASSLEVAFRALAWLWLRELLPPAAPAGFRSDLEAGLGRAAWHIERYLSIYFAPNTHLLGEAVALYFIGTLCPQFAAARRWRELGWKVVVEQAERQVPSDGLHFEQSIYYHVYALDFLIHSRLLASRNTVPQDKQSPSGTEESPLDPTILRMADALHTLAQAGAAPRFGDDDGGRLFDPARNRTEHLSDPLATCAVLFRRADFKAACPRLPEETLWLTGLEGAHRFRAMTAAAPRPHSRFFEVSGLACIASNEPLAQALLADAGPQGFGNAGHGHADALSVQLIVEGRHALTDPGAYCYPAERPERNLFRGTAAHNTLAADGLDQAEPWGPFAWRHLPRVRAEHWVEGRGGALLVASHDGFERLAAPVTHRRWVVSLGHGLYVIRDLAAGEGTHLLRVSWHVGPEFRLADAAGPQPERLRFHGPNGLALDLIPAGEAAGLYQVGEGFWSPSYGQKIVAPVAYCERQTALPAEFATAILVSRQTAAQETAPPRARFDELTKPNAKVEGLAVYRYRDEYRTVLLLFADREGPWRWRDSSCDASFAAVETDATGSEGRRIFLAGGSFLESPAGRIFDGARKVECWEWLVGHGGEQVFCSEPESVKQVTIDRFSFPFFQNNDPI